MRSEPVRYPDEGSSLLEVLVSLAIVSIAMAGLGSFFVNGNRAVAESRDQRQAIQVAAGGVEEVRALEGSSLLSGRGPVRVKDQWDKALTGPYRARLKPYLNSMQMASDPEIKDTTSTVGDEAPLSTATKTVTVGSATFERTIYVGKCEVYFLRNDDCVNPKNVTAPPNKAEILRYFRVVVLVTGPGKTCTDAGRCSYIASTLVSEAAEPTFDSNPGVPKLVTSELTFYVGRERGYQLDVDAGKPLYTWTLTSRPSWLAQPTAVGYVVGKPTALGVTNTTLRVTDSNGIWDEGTLKLIVVAPPSLIVPTASQSHVGDDVALSLATAGGVQKYAYSSANLPAELDLDPATGKITGKLTKAGAYSITVKVEDANGEADQKTFTHTVVQPVTMTVPAAQSVNLGSAVAATATAAGGTGAYTYTLSEAPAGVTISSATGVISGTPTVAGRYLPKVTVTDSAGGTAGTAAQTFELVVVTTDKLTFTAPNLVGADRTSASGTATSMALAANADILLLKNVSFTATGLPPGLKVNNGQDAIIGTPTTKGTYLVKITANSLLPVPQTAVLNLVWTIT
jgi:type II secretory pathway pseudopilin PulG